MVQAKSISSKVVVLFVALALAIAGVLAVSTEAHASPDPKKIKSGDAYYYYVPDDIDYEHVKHPDVYYGGPVNKKKTSYAIPQTVKFKHKGKTYTGHVTAIWKKAFQGCSKVKTVTSKAKLTYIGDKAFYKCKNLKSLKVPNYKINTIGRSAFEGCAKLTSAPKLVTQYGFAYIDKNAFKDCKKLKTVSIKITKNPYGGSVSVSIQSGAFRNCTSLKSVSFTKFSASSMMWLTIGENAFTGCKKLASITNSDQFSVSGDGADMAGTPLYNKL